MILFKKAADIRNHLDLQKEKGLTIGFVPTMGALHKGHLSLVESSRKDNSITVCSIFVNPAQFNDARDFERYPITIPEDILALNSVGCDLLYLPSVDEVYPGGPGKDHYDIGYLETILEGKYRPGHFQGVCKVMQRLLNGVKSQNLYLGQKDYQQSMVISKLVELLDMKEKITLNICPTLREADGLAMSSRNARLNKDERKKAPALYQILNEIKKNWRKTDWDLLINKAEGTLRESGFRVDYIEIADAATLQLIRKWDGKQKLVVLVAAFMNEVRLIDNLVINPNEEKE